MRDEEVENEKIIIGFCEADYARADVALTKFCSPRRVLVSSDRFPRVLKATTQIDDGLGTI